MNKKTLFAAAAVVLTLAACKEKKASQDIIVSKPEAFKPEAPIRMKEQLNSRDVKWLGSLYTVVTHRTAQDSLPKVKDAMGQSYVDNSVLLTISRSDGSVFFSRTFTKSSFSSYLNDDYRRNGILEALVFDDVDDGQLEFAVSVSRPESDDEFIPLEMKVDRNGGLTIRRDDQMDTSGDDDDDDDD